jgi:GR25 family glycosyltransferase involved in LPS biosynthesis
MDPTSAPRFKSFVINLESRPDRKQAMEKQLASVGLEGVEFFKAVDGSQLEPSDRLRRLFYLNDFESRSSTIGAALSHLSLWQQLILDPDHDFYLIMEDDVQLHPEFSSVLQESLARLASLNMVFFGNTKFDRGVRVVARAEHRVILPLDKSSYAGGFFCYWISKQAASSACRYTFNHGIQHGIDVMIPLKHPIDSFEFVPHVASSQVATLTNHVDSDIQRSNKSLDLGYS